MPPSWAQHVAPLCIAVPIAVACLLVALGRHVPRPFTDGVAVAVGAGVVAGDAVLLHAAAAGRVVTWSGGWRPSRTGFSVGISLVADPLGAGLALVVAALVTLALLYSWRYFEDVEAQYQTLMLLFLAGMQGFALTGDLFDMFVFFELMGAVAYALTGYKIEDASALQGALNFGIINSLGAYFSLTGVALLYARSGVLQLPQLGEYVGHRPVDALVVAGFVLVATGFLVKAAMAPFHFWLADAHAVAPSPVCILFSGVMVELGVYGVARVYWVVFGATLPHPDIRRAFLVVGVLTAVVGAAMCFAQRHLKRLLAYSTIAHVGLFICAFSTLDADGTAGGALYVAGHAGVKGALFMLAGVLLNRYGSVDEIALHGKARDARLLGGLFLLGGVALAGLPPFGTALGKAVSEEAVAAAGYPWGEALYVVVSAVTGAAVIRAGLRVFLGAGRVPEELAQAEATSGEEESETSGRLPAAPPFVVTSVVVALLGSLAVGVVPGSPEAFGRAAERFIDRDGYIAQALHGSPAHPAPVPSGAHWTALGAGLGLLSAVLAVAFALLAVYRHRVPLAVRAVGRPAAPVLRVLRGLHTGHVGDYVAWLLVGMAGLGALVGLPLR